MPSIWTSPCDNALYFIQLRGRSALNNSLRVNYLKNTALSCHLPAQPASFDALFRSQQCLFSNLGSRHSARGFC